jgi:NADPH2:quinone reductase
MNSIRIHNFGGPEVLKLEDLPTPVPAANQVLIRVSAIGVNPVETYIRAGIYGPRAFPFTPGADAAGTVESVGASVTSVKPGDRVYTAGTLSGAYAEYTLCDAAQVHPLPANVNFQQGAAIGVPYATAHRALFGRAQIKPGETVLVHGASGGVGTAACQLARAFGCRVLGTAGTPEGLAYIQQQGAHLAFNHKSPEYTQQIMDATNGAGVPCILEMLANVNLEKSLNLLSKFGRVIVIGNRGRIEINPRDTMSRDADIRGMTLNNCSPADLASIHAAIVAGLENQTLRPVIAKTYPLADAPQAHKDVIDSTKLGKLILLP